MSHCLTKSLGEDHWFDGQGTLCIYPLYFFFFRKVVNLCSVILRKSPILRSLFIMQDIDVVVFFHFPRHDFLFSNRISSDSSS
ncbi:unnamed protein product [Nezara viridula]|uniref:Uncharacterized protein n=1 Tax=Nezara viridula TaxID=85310 RepID=A0A9P0EAB9_NEZVI|nr:unnamed protein product [Nezara viridula]